MLFAISGILPKEEAIQAIKDSIKKTYSKKGEDVIKLNYDAVDHTLAHLFKIPIPPRETSKIERLQVISRELQNMFRMSWPK